MRTRRSPRNQERLWRQLGSQPPKIDRSKFLRTVTATAKGEQTLSCGHSVPLPLPWSGRFPAHRFCEQCQEAATL